MDQATSGSTAGIPIAFFDKDKNPTTPASGTYEIHCLTTGTVVRAAASLPQLAAAFELPLTAADNTMQDPTNVIERKRLIVKTTYGNGDKLTADYLYALRNVG